jgi:hypothetical protein
MQYNRRISAVILGILLILIAKSSVAQYPGMQAVYSKMALQNANQHMMMMMQMNMNWRTNAGDGDEYQVKFKDSTIKKVVSFIYADTILHKNFLVFVDKKYKKSDSAHRYQKIYPEQTLYISTIVDYRSNREIYGTPVDSCWKFKPISGAISVYAKYKEMGKDDFSPSTIVGIQLNDGDIVKYNVENLKQMVGQDAHALEEIQKKNYYKAIMKYNRNVEKAEKK